jgi:hypothetical protein
MRPLTWYLLRVLIPIKYRAPSRSAVDVTERMIDGLRIHIPHVSETGPFQKIDRFFLAPARPAGICRSFRSFGRESQGDMDAQR